MSDPFKSCSHTANKDLTAPDAAIVAVAGAVETDANNSGIPFTPLCQHGSNVGAMMLHSDSLWNSERQSVRAGDILRVRIVYNQQFLGANLIHRNQILDRLLECPKGLVVS